MENGANNKVLLTREVSRRLRMSERNVIAWANSGKLQGFKVGRQWRFHESDVEQFLETQVEKGGIDD